MADRSISIQIEADVASFLAGVKAAETAVGRFATTLERPLRSRDGMRGLGTDVDRVGTSAAKADRSINQLTGRLRLMADVAAILGPTLAPIGAVGAAGIAGLANQLGVAALAGGTAIVAFQGVGDALNAVNEAQLEPTAANLEKARLAMAQISPAAQQLVQRLQEFRPALEDIRDAAAGGMFPGVIEGLDDLDARLPEVKRIFESVGRAAGELFAGGAEDLGTDRWDEFFDFLATDATQTLSDLGQTVGSLAHGMAELWMAFDPLNDDFSGWMQDVASGFDSWASGLAQTQGFEEFIDYVRANGPQLAETVGAVANAMIQIGEAAAPLGGPVLAGIEAVAKAIATVADSDFGAPIMAGVAAFALLSRATSAYSTLAGTALGAKVTGAFSGIVGSLTNVTSAQDRARTSAAQLEIQTAKTQRQMSTLGAGLNLAALVVSINLVDAALDEVLNRDFDTTTLSRSLESLADGSIAGTIEDVWGKSLGGLNYDLNELDKNLALITDSWDRVVPGDLTPVEQAKTHFQQMDEALAGLVEAGKSGEAAAIFDQFAEKAEAGGNSVEQLRDQFEQYQIALDNAAGSGDGVADLLSGAIRGVLPDFTALGGAADDAAADIARFTGAMEELNGLLDKRGAVRDYEAAIDNLGDTVRRNGRNFDINTQKGRENQQALDDVVAATGRVMEKMKSANRIKFMQGAIPEIRNLAKQLGIPQSEVERLIAKLKDLGKQNPKPKVEVTGKEASISSINAVENALRNLNGDRATTYIDTVRTTTLKTAFGGTGAPPGSLTPSTRDADGSIHEFYADGGMRPAIGSQQPQIRGSADPRGITWAEDGAGPWEGFVSGHPAKRVRSRAITEEIVGRLDGDVEWFADGGVRGAKKKEWLGSSERTEIRGLIARRLDDLERAIKTGRGIHAAREWLAEARYSRDMIRRDVMDLDEHGGKRADRDRDGRDKREKREREKRHREIKRGIEKQIAQLEKMVDNTKQLQQTIAGNFTTDPFEDNATLQGAIGSLSYDTNRADEFRSAARNAKRLGLDGGVFKALLGSGNTAVLEDLDTRAEVRQLETAWAARNRATSNLTFGAAADGMTVRELKKSIDRLEDRLKHLGKDVKDGARQGTRDGAKEGTDKTRKRDRQRRLQATGRARQP